MNYESKDVDEWERQFESLLKVCYKYNLTLRLSKCDFCEEKIDTLGFRISQQKIEPSVKSKDNIINLKEPENLAELKHALGLVNYLHKFIFLNKKNLYLTIVKMIIDYAVLTK